MAQTQPEQVAGPAVRYDVSDGIAVLTLDQPEHGNALSQAIRTELRETLIRFEHDDEALVAILTGSGERAFCAGAHLKEMSQTAVEVPPPGYMPIAGRDVQLNKVLIAAVNGIAIGGGFLLAQMADLVVAADHATFSMPEARVGRGAPWSVPLSRMIPQRIWAELCLIGEPLSAQRMYEIGFVNAVVPAAELMATARRFAERIARNAPLTVRASQQMMALSGEMGRTAAWDVADALFVPVYRSQDAQEGPLSFRERRPPRWQGR